MDRRLLGWFPTLAIVAIVVIALLLGAWKSALLLMVPAVVSAPVRWAVPGLGFLSSDSMEKGALCLILAVLGTIALGVETSSRREQPETHRTESTPREKPFLRSVSDDSDEGTPAQEAPPVTKQERAAAFKLAADNAHRCDSAHGQAAGAIRSISAEAPGPQTRAAVEKAVESCEASWIIFNRPALRGPSTDEEEAGSDSSDGLQACDQGYLGRWLTNDDLLTALDRGLPSRDVGRIERMNSANEASITACADTLRQAGASRS